MPKNKPEQYRLPDTTYTEDIEQWTEAWAKWDDMLSDMGYRVRAFDPGLVLERKGYDAPWHGESITTEFADAMLAVWKDRDRLRVKVNRMISANNLGGVAFVGLEEPE